jgi:hypothetical protein
MACLKYCYFPFLIFHKGKKVLIVAPELLNLLPYFSLCYTLYSLWSKVLVF